MNIIQLPEGFNPGAVFNELLHLSIPFVNIAVIIAIGFLACRIIKKECK